MSDQIKFTVEMAELKKKVNFAKNGLGASKTDLAVTLFRFDVLGSKAMIFAAGKEMFCRTEMKIKRPETDARDGSFSVMGAKIDRLISQTAAETLDFIVDAENMEVHVGFLTVNFELYDGSTLKTVEIGVQEHLTMEGLATPKDALEEALSCAKSCTTSNSIRPDVTHAELREGRMLSSDGRKILVYSHDKFVKGLNLKVPSTVLANVASAVKNIDAESLQVIEGGSYYFIKGNRNEYSLGVRKVERSFPAVEGRVTAAANPTDEISIDKHVLEAMLRGVALGLASEDVKVTVEVGGTGAEAYVEVSSINSSNRRSHERASAGRKLETKVNFPISFKHLLDTLAVFKGDSVVDMMVMSELNMLMVRDTTEAREVLTIIPFRTDRQIEEEKREAAAAKEKAETQTEAQENATAGEAATAALDSTADLDI